MNVVSKTFLNRMVGFSKLNQSQARAFSTAYNVKSKFEDAYKAKMEVLSTVKTKV